MRINFAEMSTMNKQFVSLAVAGAFMALGSQAVMAAPDWAKVGKSTIHEIGRAHV
jgi:hypothetical protein